MSSPYPPMDLELPVTANLAISASTILSVHKLEQEVVANKPTISGGQPPH